MFVFGSNARGQLGTGNCQDAVLPLEIPGTFKRMAGGSNHSLLLCDQLLVCGSNADGELGQPECLELTRSIFSNAANVYAGWDRSYVITVDGHVYCTGSNRFGHLGTMDTPEGWKRMDFPCRITKVAAGLRHTLFLGENGVVWACGSNRHGQLNSLATSTLKSHSVHNEQSVSPKPQALSLAQLGLFGPVSDIATGQHHSMLLISGQVHLLGKNTYGQLASLEKLSLNTVSLKEEIVRVFSGWSTCCAQGASGRVYTWGRNDLGQCGVGSIEKCVSIPTQVPQLEGAKDISFGTEHCIALVGSNILAFGWNEHGMCGFGSEPHYSAPVRVALSQGEEPTAIGTGCGHSFVSVRPRSS